MQHKTYCQRQIKWALKGLFLYLLMGLLMPQTASAQSCLPEGITFTTQAQIDSFPINYSGCTEIEGDVTISGNGIYNLYGLSELKKVNGSVWINGCDSLFNLGGLEEIDTIGEHFLIGGNTLTNLSGLEGLKVIGGWFNIGYNNNMMNLSGIDSLTSIGSLRIAGTTLTSLTGLEGVDTIYGFMDIGGFLNGNPYLTDLNGLNNLKYVGGNVNINDNLSLLSLTGLESMTHFNGHLYISSNHFLRSIAALINVTSIDGDLVIGGNEKLDSLYGIDNLEFIGGDFRFSGTNFLQDLKGLENVTFIGGILFLANNESLISLEALNNVDSIGGYLYIAANEVLPSLSGIDSIAASSIDSLYIKSNYLLSTCEVKSICDYLASPHGTVEIHDNAPGCDSQAEVEEACTVSIPKQRSEPFISIYPNPFTTTTTIEYELIEHSHVQLTIYNAIGEQVYRAEDRPMTVGKHSFIWSADQRPEGLYYAVLRSDEGVMVVKMIKQ